MCCLCLLDVVRLESTCAVAAWLMWSEERCLCLLDVGWRARVMPLPARCWLASVVSASLMWAGECCLCLVDVGWRVLPLPGSCRLVSVFSAWLLWAGKCCLCLVDVGLGAPCAVSAWLMQVGERVCYLCQDDVGWRARVLSQPA